MDAIQSIYLDVNDPSVSENILYGKQGDGGSRRIRVNLTENGAPFVIPEGVRVSFRYLMPNGTGCDDSPVVRKEDSLEVELPEVMLAIPGAVIADLCLEDSVGGRLSTPSFVIRVEPFPCA